MTSQLLTQCTVYLCESDDNLNRKKVKNYETCTLKLVRKSLSNCKRRVLPSSPPSIFESGGYMLSSLPSGRPLTPILRDAISLYVVEWFRLNLPEMFIMKVQIAGKISKVKGRRSKSCSDTERHGNFVNSIACLVNR